MKNIFRLSIIVLASCSFLLCSAEGFHAEHFQNEDIAQFQAQEIKAQKEAIEQKKNNADTYRKWVKAYFITHKTVHGGALFVAGFNKNIDQKFQQPLLPIQPSRNSTVNVAISALNTSLTKKDALLISSNMVGFIISGKYLYKNIPISFFVTTAAKDAAREIVPSVLNNFFVAGATRLLPSIMDVPSNARFWYLRQLPYVLCSSIIRLASNSLAEKFLPATN